MKKVLQILFFIISNFSLSAQTGRLGNDTFFLKSRVHYVDMDGNMYDFVTRYNHIPTRQDSLEFESEIQVSLSHINDSIESIMEISFLQPPLDL